MKKTVLKDFNSILQLCQENTPEQAIEIILNCGQTSKYGLMLTSKDEATGYNLLYNVLFVYDSEENKVSIDNSYYDTLSALQKQQLSDCLEKVLLKSRDFERSKGMTSFITVTPLVIDIENVIGAMVFLTTSGRDNNAPIITHIFF
jgi:hypothetical protein